MIVYPTGGGTGLIGMWKAFGELIAGGWLEGPPPRMYAVQAEGCAPVVQAFGQGQPSALPGRAPHGGRGPAGAGSARGSPHALGVA